MVRRKYLISLVLLIIVALFRVEATAEKPIKLLYRGDFYEINGIVSKDVTWVQYEDMLDIIKNHQNISHSQKIKRNSQSMVTIRDFAKTYGFNLFWEDKTETIIIKKPLPSAGIIEQDITLLTKVFSNEWLKIESKEEMHSYFLGFLSPKLCQAITEVAWHFTKKPTDWHWTYTVEKLYLLDQGPHWKVILATISENQAMHKTNQGYGLFSLKRNETGEWLITRMDFNWP